VKTSDAALRTGLAGAAALAAGTGAYGAIVPITLSGTLANAAAPNSAAAQIDLNGDAVNDFILQFRNPQTTSPTGVVWQANFSPVTANGTNAVVGFQGAFIGYGTNLSAGQVIDAVLPAGASFKNAAQVTLGSIYRSGGVPTPYGGFVAGGQNNGGTGPAAARGFLGFRFDIGGQTRYGWLDVEVVPATATAGSGGIVIRGGAYEDSGAGIAAGAVPAPASLSALALGAAGLLGRKRRDERAA
jgi:hypothetical protein